ncbi:MAG: cytochrome c family protein [Hyphomicrobiaceae bacterium]
MDSFEISKFAGAALCALLAIVLPPTLVETFSKHDSSATSVGYTLPAAAKAGAPAAGGAAAPAAANIFDAVKPLLATVKPDAGASTFKACLACHSGDKGGTNKVGPALWGVVGRKTAAHEGFAFSEPMKTKGGDWTYERLAGFLANPKTYVPGTKMVYNGIQDPEKLAELLAYLGTLSDAPVPVPK